MQEGLAVKNESSALGVIEITPEQVALVKTTVFKDSTDDELKLYFFECRRRGVHPLDRLIHPVVRKDKDGNRRVTFQTSIDLFRSEAEGTGEYRGQKDVEYGEMIAWTDIDKKVPEWAKATIKRYDQNTQEIIEVSAIAYWEEYYPGKQLGFQWQKMPRLMLGKCAEALALRKAFPRKLAGLYTFEEMQLTDLVKQGSSRVKPDMKAPTEKKDDKPQVKDPEAPVSEAQTKAIHAMYKKTGFEEEKFYDYIFEIIGRKIQSTKELNKGEASKIIDKLNTYLNEQG